MLSCGFKYVDGVASNIVYGKFNSYLMKDDFKEKEDINLFYDVVCNEDEVYDFLFKNHIPFLASIHYDDWLWIYDGKSDYYEVIANYPNQFLMHFHWWNVGFKKEYFGIKKIVEDGCPYQKIYFDKKIGKNYGYIAEELHNAVEVLGDKAKKYFTEKQFDKIASFLNETFMDRIKIKEKRKELKD